MYNEEKKVGVEFYTPYEDNLKTIKEYESSVAPACWVDIEREARFSHHEMSFWLIYMVPGGPRVGHFHTHSSPVFD